ncbi:MAG: LytTR family DNA-binding domain-containing protein [Acidobacteriota bacterium]|nr:LytTR family DNA-binding domain-containing protein [Acidobacteriota bacterium]
MLEIKTLIVDDEPLARKRIKQLLNGESGIKVISECGDGKCAIAALQDLKPDLVFLDVEMPGANGVEVLEKCGLAVLPAIIFVTAYDEYTIKAFDFHAVDYLLKPYSEERFREAITRARRQINQKNKEIFNQRFADLFDYLKVNQNYLERLIVSANNRLIALPIDEIDWIEAFGNYMKVHHRGKSYLVRETLNNLSKKLDPRKFARIHRATLVNLDRIKEFHPMFGGQYTVVLHDGTELTLSRSYRQQVLSKFEP